MTTLKVHLFGKLDVVMGGSSINGFDVRKVQELFCYLLLHREHSQPREVLASLFWNDGTTAQSKTYLRKALWQLQVALNLPKEDASPAVLLVGPDSIRLNPQADIWIDVAIFEGAFNAVRGKLGTDMGIVQVQALRAAVELYRGDLLEGWYLDWCLYEREHLQQIYLAMLDKLMEYCETHKSYEAGLDYGERILRCERAHERTFQRLMRLHAQAGNRTEAMRQYERCVAVLAEEFGIAPDEQTTALYEQLRVNKLSRVPVSSSSIVVKPLSPTKSVVAATPGLSEVLNIMLHLQQTIDVLQQTIQQNVTVLESLTNFHQD